MVKDRAYVGREEAFEYCYMNGIEKLPRKGIETLTVPSIASGRAVTAIGKDEQGYYIGEFEQCKN